MRPPQRAEVARALDDIDAARRSLEFVAAHLADIHSLAYEPPVGERSGGGSAKDSDKIGGFLVASADDRGQRQPDAGSRARALCELVIGSARHSEAAETATVWGAVASQIQGLLGGEGAGHSLRGTLISPKDYDVAIAAQRRRRQRAEDPATAHLAEYEPSRTRGQRQPAYPARRAAPPKAAKPKRGWRTAPIAEET